MLLTLPEPDPGHTAELNTARHAHRLTGITLSDHELAAAARILRSLMGDDAARLLAFHDTNKEGILTFTTVLLFDRDRKLMWFNEYTRRYNECWDYPGVEPICDDRGLPLLRLEQPAVNAIEEHLERAYTALDAPTAALHATVDAFFPDDVNLLEFSIDQALAPTTTRPPHGDL